MKVPRTAVLLAALALMPISSAGAEAAPAHPVKQARSAAAKQTFASVVEDLYAAGSITDVQEQAASAAAAAARSLLRKLPAGARKSNMQDVYDLINGLADSGQLSAGRVPVTTEILARNAQYWNDSPLLSYGQRYTFSDSRIVWMYYPGAGIEPQWLGTFGAANALAKSKSVKKSVLTGLTETLDQTLALASPRAGGIAWESFFSFSGAPPVWVSALTQGTAIQALARASQKLARPDYLAAATSALGVFQTAPPEGVALTVPEGTHYLIYSTNSNLLVLNAFLQSLVGLYDYTQISQNPLGQQLFDAGNSAAVAEIPKYDTGAWSLYEGTREADLGYHELVTGFLQNLCDRTQTAIYCDTAARFTADETTPPAVRIVTVRGRTSKPVPITFTLSKISSVKMSIDGTVVSSSQLGYGTRTLTWGGRKKAGTVTVTIDATDLNGNTTSVSKAITLKRK